ncbi:Nucleic-acid-binding protein from transposon X-element [Eumeta japonica]|uniref:Nucleic-acid-binding protein from transposon X-element n=1 Tax=Eumeta variegata TaxID=151549 RepID=A0A4C1X1S5_EUMVA|nr:Nucleic-acid-binding protein from transposon X-element [Eumeta japonica]
MDAKLKSFLAERGLLKDFEEYCSSPASPESASEMDIDKQYVPRTTVHYPSDESESDYFHSDDSKGGDEPFTKVQSRKARARRARLIASGAITLGPGFQCYSPAKPKNNPGPTPSPATPVAPTPTPSWRNMGEKKKPEQTDNDSKKAKKPKTIVVEDDDAPLPAPRKEQKPPPIFLWEKEKFSEIRRQCELKNITISHARNTKNKGLKVQPDSISDFRNLTNLLATMKAAYHTYSLKEEREFRVVLKGVLRVSARRGIKVELPHKRSSPGQCHNCQLYGHSSKNCFRKARCVKCLGDHGTAACTRNKETDGPPACVLCNTSGHTANYLGCPRAAPKKYPTPSRNNRDNNSHPNDKAAPRRAPARAVSKNATYANVTAGRRKDPPKTKSDVSTDTLSQIMSVISIIDINELADLAKSFKAASNPVEKLLILAKHASLVETIKNNKF